MIEFLYNTLGSAPVVGQPITMAYLGKRVNDAVRTTTDRKLDPKTAEMAGDELDGYLQDEANGIYDEQIAPLVREKGIPDALANPLKEKAIEKLVGALKDKIQDKMTTADQA